MRNILVVCEDLRINNSSAGIGRSKIINTLAEVANKIDVITIDNFNYPITWLPNNVKITKITPIKSKRYFWDNIPKIKNFYNYSKGYSKNEHDIISAYKTEIFKHVNDFKYDFIYLLGSGSSFLPYFIFPSNKIKIPYVVNIHDPYPMHLYPKPYKKKKHIFYLHQQINFNKVLKGAYKITLPSKLLLNDLAKSYSSIYSKGVVLPHIGTDLIGLQGQETDDIVKLPKNKINIIHAGNLLGPRNPMYLIQAINELNNEVVDFKNNVQFTFFGTFNKAHKKLIEETNISNIIFNEQRVTYKKSIELTKQADANLVIEAIADYSPFLPGKVADIAFCNSTIIALTPKVSEVNRVLGNDYPYSAELDKVYDIKKVLLPFLIIIKKVIKNY
ncbi:hypothetical protein K5I29_08115 [Flavobacterium agricola]|uniref:Uncharacterized protein n=1 Tax=Flavobacterium agricola TaxID=2870839 RepID=A0ABY6LW09_9FLAO|nr:hypothetical protein [Flavobacterium agricola]UYW00513.1 hypothetical protein K5I29_08115 [Flavobacterium agricola]